MFPFISLSQNKFTLQKDAAGVSYTYLKITKNGTPLHTYGYASTGWKDLLTSFDGTSITYDQIGNPNNWRDGMTFTWQAGRQLATLQKGTTGVSYTYGSDGTRLTKTVNGVKTSYTWDGAQLVSQTTTGGDTLYFIYHGDSRVAVEYKGNTYYYIYNLQGDVVGLVNSSGNTVVSYTYDAWGNPESISGSMASTLGAANPFRYRGYYYDIESGLYYLMSRYYDPVVGRFLNADSLLAANSGMAKYNLFVYCGNNPIIRFDPSGCNWLDALSKLFMSQEQWRALENTKFGTPIYGEPNSWLHIPSSSGTNDIDRYFGPDGRAHHDVHWGHAHHHPGVGSPHTEDWKWDGDRAKPDPDSARPYDPAKDGTPPPHPQSVPQPSQSSSFTIDPQVITVVTTAIFVIGGIYILLTTGNPTVLEEAFAR